MSAKAASRPARRARSPRPGAAAETSSRDGQRLAAILAADVAGYSRLMSLDEAGTLRLLIDYRRRVDALLERHGGRVANTAGDSLLAEFGSARDAVACAVAVQHELAALNRKRGGRAGMELRIGVHAGDTIHRDGDLFGDAVNIAARLQGLATPGGICVSGAVADAVRGHLRVELDDIGPQQLHNLDQSVRVFRVRLPAAAGPANGRAAGDGSGPAAGGGPSIAVMPFDNLSGDPGQDYFVDGVVEEIIGALSRFRWLAVAARNSTFAFRGRPVDVRSVSRDLNVRFVLEGSCRREGSHCRITTQLLDGRSGMHIWSDNIDGELGEMIGMQDRIAARAVTAIAPRVREAEIAQAARLPAKNLGAYDLFLRALFHRAVFTPAGTAEAIGLLERAVERDPYLAPAFAHLAMCRTSQRDQGWVRPSAEHARLGVAHAWTAVHLDPNDPSNLILSGHTVASLGDDVPGGMTLIDRAIQLNPNLAEAWARSAMVSVYAGETEAAIERARRALALSPYGPDTFLPHCAIGYAQLFAGRAREALDAADTALRGLQKPATAHRLRLAALVGLDRLDEARAEAARLRDLDPELRVSTFGARTPFRRPEQLATLTGAFASAGVPD
jgi:adenylate cyclase